MHGSLCSLDRCAASQLVASRTVDVPVLHPVRVIGVMVAAYRAASHGDDVGLLEVAAFINYAFDHDGVFQRARWRMALSDGAGEVRRVRDGAGRSII